MEDVPAAIADVTRFTAAMLDAAKTLSSTKEARSQAAIDAGNRADRAAQFAKGVGERLF